MTAKRPLPPRLPATAALVAVARRVVWFEPAREVLANPNRLMAYAAAYATAEDMAQLRLHFTDAQFADALDAAPPGIIDGRSWAYWNLMLGRYPPPPQPQRRLGQDASLTPSSSGRASRAGYRRRG